MEETTSIDMSKRFSKVDLLKYAFPAIIMMFTVSVYEIIDGFFVSNFVNSTAFAAVNLIFPLIMIFASFGLMIGTGSSAIIANKMGEKSPVVANRYFSMFVYFTVIAGIFLSVLGIFLVRPVAILLGAEGELLDISVYYGMFSLISLPAYILQMAFMSFFNTAGKPSMGFFSAVVCCLVILILNTIFTAILKMGINGILISTITCEYIGAIIPLVYFSNRKNKSLLHLVGPKKAFENQNPSSLVLIIKSCINGSSEAVQDIAASLVVLLCVFQLNRFIGENGIVAFGVADYAWIIFNSFYLGFCVAVAPLMSYQQGAKNKKEMRSLFSSCSSIILAASFIAFALAEIFAPMIAGIFVGYDDSLCDLSIHAFRIYSVTFLFAGISIYGSSMFTSLGNGAISALIAFLRTIVFEVAALLIIPELFGADGIWWAIACAEIMAAILTIIFIGAKGKKYGILKAKR